MFNRVLARVGIRLGERPLVARFFWLHFALIASYTLARAVRDAVFLGEMSARRLPYLYIAVAGCTAVIAAGMGRFTNRPNLQRWLSQILVFSGVVLLGFAALLYFVRGSVPPIAFYLWTGAYGLIHVSLFWVLANEAIDSSEAKRFFGIIGAGGILGGLAGGALVTFASWALRPVDLMLAAAAILFAVAPLAARLLEPMSSSRIMQMVRDEDEGERRHLLQHRYVRLLALLFLLAGMTSAVLDFRFKVALQTATAAQPGAIARFLGYYYVLLNSMALVLQIFVSRSVLRRFGASSVAMLLPAGVVAGAVAGFAVPGSMILVAGTRLYDAVMRISLARTSYEFFFYPLPASLRRRARAWIDVFVDRAAEALAGLAILAFYALLRGTPTQRVMMTLILALAWLAASYLLRRAYGRQLATSLRSLVSDPERKTAAIPEAQLIAEAHRLLATTFEKRAVFAFELLESIDPEGLDARLEELLEHRVPAVRARALGRMAGFDRAADAPLLRRATHDESAAVRIEALRLYVGHNEEADTRLRELLTSNDLAERAAAIEHMVARPGLLGDAEVEAYVERGTPAERRAVAVGIARRPAQATTPETLLRLLDDEDLDVRRQAIEACGALRRREFIPALLPHLARPGTAATARLALAAYGNRVVGTLADWMRDPSVSAAIRWAIPAVLAAIGTQEAADELMRLDGAGDTGAGYHVLKALNKIRERQPSVTFERTTVRSRLGREVETFARIELHLRVWRAEAPSRARDLLVTSLEQRLDFAMNRIFRRLGLIYAQREMRVGYRAVAGTSRRTRAQAVEFLETALLPEDRRVLQPMLEDDPQRRVALAAAVFGLRVADRAASLHDLVHGDDAWLQSCALFAIGSDRHQEHAALVTVASPLRHPLSVETAAWSRRRLESA